MYNYTAVDVLYLKLRASSKKSFQCVQMVFIGKGLYDAIHEVILC